MWLSINNLNNEFPAELSYTEDHEWVRIEDDGTAVVGITDFAQHELGDIIYIDVTTVGQSLAKGDVFGAVEAVKTVSDLFLPIEGEIVELNPAIEKKPRTIKQRSIRRRLDRSSEAADGTQNDGLLTADAYQELVGA